MCTDPLCKIPHTPTIVVAVVVVALHRAPARADKLLPDLAHDLRVELPGGAAGAEAGV